MSLKLVRQVSLDCWIFMIGLHVSGTTKLSFAPIPMVAVMIAGTK